jgi:hypothetical protein
MSNACINALAAAPATTARLAHEYTPTTPTNSDSRDAPRTRLFVGGIDDKVRERDIEYKFGTCCCCFLAFSILLAFVLLCVCASAFVVVIKFGIAVIDFVCFDVPSC